MGMPVCPFVEGNCYYKPVPQPEKVRIPCPVCAGNKAVEIILGSGEHMMVPCEACGLGFEKSRGYIEEYRYTPRATAFVVKSIEGYAYDEWLLKNELGEQVYGSSLYYSEQGALDAANKQSQKQQERNARAYSQTKQSAKKMTWSIRYHRECIKDLEQKIAYHQGAITAQQVVKRG